MEENQNANFLIRQESDNEALTNFLEIDGWRKVNDVLYTKIVRVKDLNGGWDGLGNVGDNWKEVR
jgi:hypothetical protein